MNEDEREILETIIANDGSCTGWANRSICKRCPMSRLKERPNGGYYSCFEAICVGELSEEQADAKYKRVAQNILADESIDEMLTEE